MFSICEAEEIYTVGKKSILYTHKGKLTSNVSQLNGIAVSEKCLIFYVYVIKIPIT